MTTKNPENIDGLIAESFDVKPASDSVGHKTLKLPIDRVIGVKIKDSVDGVDTVDILLSMPYDDYVKAVNDASNELSE